MTYTTETPSTMTVTHKQIREYLGHNGHECRVRIKKDGRVLRYGSPEPTDRSKDFWADMGTVAEVAHSIEFEGRL